MNAREYLIDRFQDDSATLRARAASLRSSSQAAPGPDAKTSEQMAGACERVLELLRSVSEDEEPGIQLQSLAALTLPLEEFARDNASAPAVRAVYTGAATRIRELLAAEERAAASRDSVDEPGRRE